MFLSRLEAVDQRCSHTGYPPVMTDTRIQLCTVVYIIIGVILHVGISHSQIKFRSPVFGKREFVTVAYPGSQQRTIRILITVIVPLHVKPCHMGVQSDKVSPPCLISYPPASLQVAMLPYAPHAYLPSPTNCKSTVTLP